MGDVSKPESTDGGRKEVSKEQVIKAVLDTKERFGSQSSSEAETNVNPKYVPEPSKLYEQVENIEWGRLEYYGDHPAELWAKDLGTEITLFDDRSFRVRSSSQGTRDSLTEGKLYVLVHDVWNYDAEQKTLTFERRVPQGRYDEMRPEFTATWHATEQVEDPTRPNG